MSDSFHVSLTRLDGYRFQVELGDGLAPFVVDEGPPLGQNAGPNPTRTLATAVAHCLSASLLFALGKSRVPVQTLATRASGTLVRNAEKRLRIGRIDVVLVLGLDPADRERAGEPLKRFEDFCTVTASVRQGLPVGVRVESPSGELLHANG